MKPDAVRSVARAHHGGRDDPTTLDFSANTNPEVPSGTRDAYEAAFDATRRYPADDYPTFRAAAADYVGCSPESVVPTPGGLAGLRLALATRVRADDRVLVPAPGFAEYAREARLQGGTVETAAPGTITSSDPAPYRTVVVCAPNNPTAHDYTAGELRAFAARCRAADTELLVDEAFRGFTDRPSLAGEDGVVVARSLTKLFGTPGIRAGFLVATGQRRETLATARRAWTLSAPAAAVGAHCMRAEAFVQRTRERVRSERERLRTELAAFGTVDGPLDDATQADGVPFLLFSPAVNVDRLLETLTDRGIALRDARTFDGLDRHVRIAVRTPEDHDRLLPEVRDVCE